jgi:hypothetical protein
MRKKPVDTVNKKTHNDNAHENIEEYGDLHKKRHPAAQR